MKGAYVSALGNASDVSRTPVCPQMQKVRIGLKDKKRQKGKESTIEEKTHNTKILWLKSHIQQYVGYID